jgi:hypothetical protein
MNMTTHKDPICGMQIEESETVRHSDYQEHTYYFLFGSLLNQIRRRTGKIRQSNAKELDKRAIALHRIFFSSNHSTILALKIRENFNYVTRKKSRNATVH